MQLKGFQIRANHELMAAMAKAGCRDIVFKSPTGSGKTIVLTTFIQDYVRENPKTVFVWLTPGEGGLAEQSKAKMDVNCHGASTKLLDDVMTGGFAAGDAVFINWQKLNRDSNNALKDSERMNFFDRIAAAKADGLAFKIVIDESHHSFTATSKDIVDWFNPDKIVLASATPRNIPNAMLVEVPEEDVIAEGLIKKRINVNPGFPMQVKLPEGETPTAYLLDKAYAKYTELKTAFGTKGVGVHPLILVQLPNDSDALLGEIEAWFAAKGADIENKKFAVWLANRKDNVEGIAANDAQQVAVVIKQAVATGWDCPRAQILVKLRENTDETFEIQTIGRIRRMPEAKHYSDDLLDECYLYTFDGKFTAGLMGRDGGDDIKVATLFLKNEHKSFSLMTEQRTMIQETRDAASALEAIAKWFKQHYGATGNAAQNKAALEARGYSFNPKVVRSAFTGEVTTTKELQYASSNLNVIGVEEEANTHKHGRDFHHSIGEIGAAGALPYDDMRLILYRLFADDPTDPRKLLKLSTKAMYAFVINNEKKLKEDVITAMSTILGLTVSGNPISRKQFKFPLSWLCAYSEKEYDGTVSAKNVYAQYPCAAMTAATRSIGEMKFENWCETTAAVDWVYRNGDKGDEFFSVVYEDNSGHQRLFYPDYVVSVGGCVWVVEVKGGFNTSGQSENIDPYAEKKAAALKVYCEKYNLRGGFVCHKASNDKLYFFENGFSEDVEDPNWRPIYEVIKGE